MSFLLYVLSPLAPILDKGIVLGQTTLSSLTGHRVSWTEAQSTQGWGWSIPVNQGLLGSWGDLSTVL